MNVQEIEKLATQLRSEEGLVLKPYRDSLGKITIGVGRCLDTRGISESEALYLLANDIQSVIVDLDRDLPWWRSLDPIRARVLADMCFNLGITGLLAFKYTLLSIQNKQWRAASSGMKASKWATQIPGRVRRLATMMETGEDLELENPQEV